MTTSLLTPPLTTGRTPDASMKLVTARAIFGCHGHFCCAKNTPCTSETGSSLKQARAIAR